MPVSVPCLPLTAGTFLEVRRRRKLAEMERYALKRMRRKFKVAHRSAEAAQRQHSGSTAAAQRQHSGSTAAAQRQHHDTTA